MRAAARPNVEPQVGDTPRWKRGSWSRWRTSTRWGACRLGGVVGEVEVEVEGREGAEIRDGCSLWHMTYYQESVIPNEN